ICGCWGTGEGTGQGPCRLVLRNRASDTARANSGAGRRSRCAPAPAPTSLPGGTMANDDKEIDRMAREGGKSEWQERSAPAAGDPVTDAERKGLNLLGQSDPRGDGSLWGVGDPNGGD